MSPRLSIRLLVLCALVLRLALVPYHASRPLVSDFLVYTQDAERLVRGEAILDDPKIANRAPVYSFFLAGVFALFGRSLAAAYAIQALLWCAAGLAVWTWCRKPLGEGGAIAALALFLFHPDGLVASGLSCVESLGAVLLVALLHRFSRSCERESGASGALLDGILAGLAVLTVTPLLVFVGAALGAVALLRRRGGIALRSLALVPAGMALVVAPWAARNAYVLDGFVPLSSISGTALYGGNNAEADGGWNEQAVQRERAQFASASELEWNAHARQEVLEFVLHRPGRWLRLEGMKLAMFFSPKPGSFYRGRLVRTWIEIAACPAFWMPMLVLLPFGFFPSRRLEPATIMAALAILAFLLTTLTFFALVRYRITYLAAFSFLAVAGAQRLRETLMRGSGPRRALLVSLALWSASLIGIWTWILRAEWGKILTWLAGPD